MMKFVAERLFKKLERIFLSLENEDFKMQKSSFFLSLDKHKKRSLQAKSLIEPKKLEFTICEESAWWHGLCEFVGSLFKLD